MNSSKAQCAFHKNKVITNFCESQACLLPLCQQCIGIHQQQHTSIKDNIRIVSIDLAINQIHKLAARENSRIQTIYRQNLTSFQKTITLHNNLKKQLFDEQSQVVHAISASYNSMIQEVQNSIKRKQNWFREFTIQVNLARTELIHIQNSLNSQKYLRYIIMWNKLKPQDIITQIIHNNQKANWVQPKSQKINILDFMTTLTESKNLKLLELTGDMGISKVIKTFQILRFGQEPRSSRPSGISVTAEKKNYKKLLSVKSADKF